MTKSYGSFIKCTVCGREPFADDPAMGSFDLRRFNASGAPAGSPTEGEWRCSLHFPSRQRVPSAAKATPLEAVAEFERLLSATSDRSELERGLVSLRKAIAAQKPPPSLDDAPKARRRRLKPITASERSHEGQTSLIDEEAAETP
jgi:hypothetical protein